MTRPFITTGTDTVMTGCALERPMNGSWMTVFPARAAIKSGRSLTTFCGTGFRDSLRDGRSDHGGLGIVQGEGLKNGIALNDMGEDSVHPFHGFGVVSVLQQVSHQGRPGPTPRYRARGCRTFLQSGCSRARRFVEAAHRRPFPVVPWQSSKPRMSKGQWSMQSQGPERW